MYRYSPLNSDDEAEGTASKARIRLIALEPGAPDDPLCCAIIHVCLEDDPTYTALSYSWGPAGDETLLRSSTGNFFIRESLRTALIQLRDPIHVKNVWIDVICINQADIDEKNEQVAIMHKIYQKAVEAVAWLGEPTTGTAEAYALVISIDEYITNNPRPVVPKNTILGSMDAVLRLFNLPKSGNSEWLALAQLLCRPYFQRAWTLQEYLVSKHLYVVCGNFSLPAKIFASLVSFDSLLKAATREHVPDGDRFEEGYANDWGLLKRIMCRQQPLEAFNRDMEEISEGFEAAMFMIAETWTPPHTWMTQWQEERPRTLFSLLIRARKRQASDPRDKVFSLFNIATEERFQWYENDGCVPPTWVLRISATGDPYFFNSDPDDKSIPTGGNWDRQLGQDGRVFTNRGITKSSLKLPPLVKADYRLALEDLMTSVAQYLLSSERPLDMFAFVDVSKPLTSPSRPSWAPDWSEPISNPYNAFSRNGIEMTAGNFLATGSSKAAPHVSRVTSRNQFTSSTILSLLGIQDSVVMGVNPIYNGTQPNFMLRQVARMLEEQNVHHIPAAMLWSAWDCWEEKPMAGRSSKSIFYTSRGCIGIGPARMRANDLIVLLMGGRVPYVLRPIDICHYAREIDATEADVRTAINEGATEVMRVVLRNKDMELQEMIGKLVFQLVGECYIPDIMYGEGLIWARAKSTPHCMKHNTGPGLEENGWLKTLGAGPFNFITQVIPLC